MRILFTIILGLTMFACSTKSSNNNSHWLNLKDSFHFQNLQDFTADTGLVLNFFNKTLDSSFHSIKDKQLDSIFSQTYYLYSWQRQNTTLTAFTILTEGFGECLEIRLLTFDKFDKLISDIIVAKFGGEPGSYSYETKTHFKNQDTFLTTHTRTYANDELTQKKLSRIVGDTLWVRHIFNKSGEIKSQITDSSLTSHKFKNKDGCVTERMLKNAD